MINFTLNNGTEIPSVGIGTFMLSPDEAEASVVYALQHGYTLIDTANAYVNEKAVGRGMKKSGLKREEIYLSTKLWPSVYDKADEAIDETLARLDTPYIDMLYLHQPAGDYMHAYHAMERAVKAGKVKSLGLSNFPIEKIKEVIAGSEIKPAMLQVEAHPYYPQTELKEYLQTFGARIMAWYPLGHGDKNLLNEPVVTKIARKYQKSNAQVLLRWQIQEGNVIIPGSKNPAHISDNIDLFDFVLDEEDMQAIASLNNNHPYYVATPAQLEMFKNYHPDMEGQK